MSLSRSFRFFRVPAPCLLFLVLQRERTCTLQATGDRKHDPQSSGHRPPDSVCSCPRSHTPAASPVSLVLCAPLNSTSPPLLLSPTLHRLTYHSFLVSSPRSLSRSPMYMYYLLYYYPCCSISHMPAGPRPRADLSCVQLFLIPGNPEIASIPRFFSFLASVYLPLLFPASLFRLCLPVVSSSLFPSFSCASSFFSLNPQLPSDASLIRPPASVEESESV